MDKKDFILIFIFGMIVSVFIFFAPRREEESFVSLLVGHYSIYYKQDHDPKKKFRLLRIVKSLENTVKKTGKYGKEYKELKKILEER